MNIVIVCDTVFKFLSGAAKSVIRSSDGLIKKKNKVVILTSRRKGELKQEIINRIKVYRFIGAPIPKTQGRGSFGLPAPYRMIQILNREKPDVVHVHLPTYLCLTAIITARMLKVPVVSSFHTQPQNIWNNVPEIDNIVLNKATKRFVAWFNNLSDVVVCPSKFSEDYAKKLGVKVKTEIVSNGVDLNVFKPQNADNIKKRLNLNKNVILYVGRLMYEKKVDILIKSLPLVLKKIPDVKCVIVGEGFLKDDLKEQAQKLGVENKVIFTDKVSDEELPLFYNICDVFVTPSEVELQGMTILEAEATGKPVIVSDSEESAGKDLIKDNGFVFKNRNYKDLAEKIIKILSDEELKRKMGKKSLEIVQKHSIEKSVDKLENIYKNLANKEIKWWKKRIF